MPRIQSANRILANGVYTLGDSENNAGDALAAMLPLQEAAGNGIAVIVLRHDRKSGGLVGESARESSIPKLHYADDEKGEQHSSLSNP